MSNVTSTPASGETMGETMGAALELLELAANLTRAELEHFGQRWALEATGAPVPAGLVLIGPRARARYARFRELRDMLAAAAAEARWAAGEPTPAELS